MVEAEVIVRKNKNKLPLCQLDNFRNIRERVARLGDDNIAIVTLELGKQCALSSVAGIIANNDFDVRSRPGTGLGDSGASQKIRPIGRNQDGELHGPCCLLMARPRARRGGIAWGPRTVPTSLSYLSDSRRSKNVVRLCKWRQRWQNMADRFVFSQRDSLAA